jgi:outer membrane protein assembly factor BamB
VREGVVFVGTSDGRLLAFDAGCREACQPIWSRTIGGGAVGLAIDGSTVLASARGTLQAFTPSGT